MKNKRQDAGCALLDMSYGKIVLGLLCVICVIGVICGLSSPLFAVTWPDFSNGGNSTWVSGYYRPITVTNSTASTLTDYQVAITLTTAALGNPYTHIKADGSDIRFSTNPPPNSGTELSYWIESWIITGTSTIWVKVPNLPTGTSQVYMYYGNISATSASNISKTFIFGDDFSSGTIDATKWPTNTFAPANYSITGGILKVWSDNVSYKSLVASYTCSPSDAVIAEALYKTENTQNMHYYFSGVTTSNNRFAIHPYFTGLTGPRVQYRRDPTDTTWLTSAQYATTAANTWYIHRIDRQNSTTFKASTYDVNYNLMGSYSLSANEWNAETFTLCIAEYNNVNSYWAWFRVRKYASPEPTASAPGAETQYTLTKYVQSANWTSLVHAANPVAMGNAIAVISFTAVATGTTTAHWRRFRIDETGGQPIEKLTVSVYEESGNDNFFDAADKFIASGTFNSSRTCYLNMNRWPIGTTPKTYYIVEKVTLDGSGGPTIRLNIADGSYFDFEEGPCIGVPP